MTYHSLTNLLKVKTLHDTEAKLVERVSNKDSWWAVLRVRLYPYPYPYP